MSTPYAEPLARRAESGHRQAFRVMYNCGMPALDRDHQIVRNALTKDGWTITHDPLTIEYDKRDLHIDLGAERLIAAERGAEKIAVEIKTFAGVSDVANLHNATGQYVVYKSVLALVEPERRLLLAVPSDVANTFFREDLGALLIQNGTLQIVGYDLSDERITIWLP